MTGWRLFWETIGALFQVLGLVAVAVGIGKTWAENAGPDDNLATKIFGPAIRFVWHRILRRPARVNLGAAAISVDVGVVTATGLLTKSLDPDASPEEQLQQVKAEVDAAWAKAHEAVVTGQRAERKIEDLRRYVDRQDVAVQESTETRAKRQAVEGVPVAVMGLVATALGTVVQFFAGFLG